MDNFVFGGRNAAGMRRAFKPRMQNLDPKAKKTMTTQPEAQRDAADQEAAKNVEEQRGEGRGKEPGKKKHPPKDQKTH